MRTGAIRQSVLLVIFAIALATLSCSDVDTGPNLIVDVPESSLELQPTTGNNALCCCRIVGRVVNASEVPVHVTLQFEAFRAGEQEPAGTAVDFIKYLRPNEDRAVSASGLLFPCPDVDRFELVDVDLRGVVFP